MFGTLWWGGLIFSVLFIALTILLARRLGEQNQKLLGKGIGFILIFFALGIHIYEWIEHRWQLQHSLPLQLCALSGILSGLVFFWSKQGAYELLVFWGIPGAAHSLLTPEMSHGNSLFLITDYYVSHAGIILAALYLPIIYKRQIRVQSWLWSFIFTLGLIAMVALINYLLHANYMYLCRKPVAENPFVIGEWPWYIGGLMVAGLIHFVAVYWLFKKLKWVSN
jgi:hypothetical integral membrane protein (TIGR02206 family)